MNECVPVTVFTTTLSPLEAIIKFLKEERGMKYSVISRLLARDQRCIRITYLRAAKKAPVRFKPAASRTMFPLALLRDRSLSPAEQVTRFLRGEGLRYCDIARLLGKDDRTIWTLARRSEEKIA
ncbi:hypothetical protein GOV07_00950 [Candidatus Woesearchaeota archaeon]|nr:hypothetical protein [Candidatus Woesearchaeota archaeon]